MKPLLLCLAAIAWHSCAVQADEIVVNSNESPDDIAAYYMDDFKNSGVLSGPPAGKVNLEEVTLQVGDLGDPDVLERVRKGFLLFHLPPLDGRKLKSATLRVHFGIAHQADEKPLPPAWLFHAEDWNDEAWESDPRWRGLTTAHFADEQSFSKKLPLCGADDKPGPIELDVTGMIQGDYQRANAPVAVFRLEISDREALDITDQRKNAYGFVGPGVRALPGKTPTLTLTVE